VVSPTLVRPVVAACVARGIPVFPGALTPQEIQTAWQAGASMVKVFPAKAFGPGYFREIKGPFDRIPLLACGGISPENLGDYARCGADAFAFGSSVFDLERIAAKDFGWVEAAVRALVRALPGSFRAAAGNAPARGL
jgi:2-dehydro-3-deoxyphosphogluconate aldolase/(4S)-4-hydroxy-2-oxoglutarate aldolase